MLYVAAYLVDYVTVCQNWAYDTCNRNIM